MASNLHNLLFTLLFLSATLHPPATTAQQECPYPCYPPPIGGGSQNTPPAATLPPPAGTSNYPPPTFYNPPIIPNYNPSPPNFVFGAPPPPDPVVPWFPYYYREPLHPSSSATIRRSAATGSISIMMQFLVLPLILFLGL